MTIRVKTEAINPRLGPLRIDENRIRRAAARILAQGQRGRLPKKTGELSRSVRATAQGVRLVGNHSSSGISNQQLAQIRGGTGVFQSTADDIKTAGEAVDTEIQNQIKNGRLRM